MMHNLILDATNKYEIYFLLTAYLESVRYGDKLGMLPKELTRLPCSGIDDIWQRLDALRAELQSPHAASHEPREAILREAAATLGASVRRLRQLDGEAPAALHEDGIAAGTHTT